MGSCSSPRNSGRDIGCTSGSRAAEGKCDGQAQSPSLQVVARVGEVEALVGEREVRDDGVGEGDGQRGPVQERRVDDLAARESRRTGRPRRGGRCCPASPRRSRARSRRGGGPGGAATLSAVACPARSVDQAERGTDLLGSDGKAGMDVPAVLACGAEPLAEVGEGMRDAGVECEPGGAGDDAERADAGRVRARRARRCPGSGP